MKKSIIVVAILLVVIAILPVVGNSFMKKTLDDRLIELQSFGLEAKTDTSDSSYLSTSRHFEFLLKDSDKFINYLNKYSDQQIPPYVNAMLNDVLIGADIKYSNLPFAKDIEVEIYPLALSSKMKESLKKDDAGFEKYVSTLLESKGILYHINYNIMNSEFKGYVKDMKEQYKFDKNTQVKFTLNGTTFSGEGSLIAPTKMKSKIKSLKIDVVNDGEELNLNIEELKAKSKFDSKNHYETSLDLEKLLMIMQGTQNDLIITMQDVGVEASSDDKGDTTKLESELSFKTFEIHSNKILANIKKFNFEVEVNKLNKEKFEIFRSLASKNDMSSGKYQKELQNSLLQLIEKGLVINIKKFALKDINIKKMGEMKGFKVSSKITIKEDPALAQKIQMSPLMALGDIDMSTKIKVSKTLYSYMLQNQGMLTQLNKYAKEDGDNFIFDFDFINSKISINGKALN